MNQAWVASWAGRAGDALDCDEAVAEHHEQVT
jgi:hypothetical protein